jgi:hypothetical protein
MYVIDFLFGYMYAHTVKLRLENMDLIKYREG